MNNEEFKPIKRLAMAIVMANIEQYGRDKHTYNLMLKNLEQKKKILNESPNDGIRDYRYQEYMEQLNKCTVYSESVMDRWKRWFLDEPQPLDSFEQKKLDELKEKTGLDYPDAHQFRLPITELLQGTDIDNTHLWAKINDPKTKIDGMDYNKLSKFKKIQMERAEK